MTKTYPGWLQPCQVKLYQSKAKKAAPAQVTRDRGQANFGWDSDRTWMTLKKKAKAP